MTQSPYRQPDPVEASNRQERGRVRRSVILARRSLYVYTLLGNPIYVGEVRHKGTRHPRQHQAIVERTVWEKTEELLHAHSARSRGTPGRSMSSPLAGKLFDQTGDGLTPSHAVKGKRRYRYYVSRSRITGTAISPKLAGAFLRAKLSVASPPRHR